MNRRSFFKLVTGFVAGVFGVSAKPKSQPKTLTCGGKGGTLCPRCKFNCKVVSKSGPPGPTEIDTMTMGGYSNYIYICGVSDLNDDTKVIQEAIDLAKDGGIVYFPKGTYNIKLAISCPVHQPRL